MNGIGWHHKAACKLKCRFTGRFSMLRWTRALNTRLYLGHIQEAPFASSEVVDAPLVELVAVQAFDAVASGGNHAFDLVVFALG